jgi:predicted dinucleotide-binding enzyme
MTKVAILGSGQVGEALAKGFLARGNTVMRASRDPSKLAAWKESAGPTASVGTYAEAAAWGELIVLSVKGSAAEEVLDQCGLDNLAGKTVIDTTNPIAEGKPDNGVLRYFTNANESLMERLQAKAPKANFVKAFNSVGNMFMVDPPFKPRATMFIGGNSADAKKETTAVLEQFGWDVTDIGGVEAARPIESLCILWCAPGFLRNDWAHAFAWLKLG